MYGNKVRGKNCWGKKQGEEILRIKHGKKVLDECVWGKNRGKKLWGRKSGEESKGKEMRGRENEIRPSQ